MHSLALCSGLLLSAATAAAEVGGLYQATVPVANREDPTRLASFERSFADLIGRVTRIRDQQNPAVRALLAKPQLYVLQYEYAGGSDAEPLRLKILFDETRIREQLRQHGIATFGAERPELLLWLAAGEGATARLVGGDSDPELAPLLKNLATASGLPIQLPLGDLEDSQRLSAADLSAGDAARIKAASARYETPLILTGVLQTQADRHYTAEWRLYGPDRLEQWRTTAGTLPETLRAGLSGAYAWLADRLVPADFQVTESKLRVHGVGALDDVNRITGYLKKLPLVSAVEWLGVGPTEASFKLRSVGGRDALGQYLRLSGLFEPEPTEAQATNELVWRLRR